MDKMDAFVEKLNKSDLYNHLIQMKAKIESNPLYLSRYQEILETQKKLVGHEFKGQSESALKVRLEYERKLAELTSDVLIHEYLTDLDEFNNLIHTVEDIFNESINSIQELPKFPHI